MSVNSKMTAIADEIRTLSGTTGTMGLDAMATHVGEANDNVSTQTDLLAQAVAALEGKAGGSGANIELQDKSVTPSTNEQVITFDSDYDGLSSVTVSAMPTTTQATPSITVSSSGLITASATQTAGYVTAGTKSGTKQLTTQAAKTITPSTSSQTAVASGRYTTGTVTVAAVPTQTKSATPSVSSQTISPDSGKFLSSVTVSGDSNLVAGNIKSGVSIFGVAGSYEGSSGSSSDSGSGSDVVETCSVELSMPKLNNLVYFYAQDGVVYCKTFYVSIDATPSLLTQFGVDMTNVVKGSFLICGKGILASGTAKITTTGDVEIVTENVAYTVGAVFKINGDCSITISE